MQEKHVIKSTTICIQKKQKLYHTKNSRELFSYILLFLSLKYLTKTIAKVFF